MRKIAPDEWILARLTTPDRAAAILGDLLELSATRGRLWFWASYARTLITLGWRTPVAFLFAIASMRFVFGTFLPALHRHRVTHLMEAGLFGEHDAHVSMVLWNISFVVAQCLIFATPFVFARFGRRDRLTQLACILFLVAMPVYSLRPWLMDLAGVLTALVLVASTLSPLWRKPAIILAGTSATAIGVVVAWVFILSKIYHQNILALAISSICEPIAFAIAAIVCTGLHQLLLRRRPTVALMD